MSANGHGQDKEGSEKGVGVCTGKNGEVRNITTMAKPFTAVGEIRILQKSTWVQEQYTVTDLCNVHYI